MAPATLSPLSVDSILDHISKSLATTSESGAESTPLLKDPYAAIAVFSHACMVAVGFRLIGLGEDDRIGMHSKFAFQSVCSAHLVQKHNPTPTMSHFFPRNGMPPPHLPFDMHILNLP